MARAPSPGQLDQRVWIDARVQTRAADTGEVSVSWSPVVEVWARVELVRAPGAITEREEMLEGGTTDAKGELRLAFLRPGAVRVCSPMSLINSSCVP